jgi:diacylglycerol kinase
MSGAKPSQDDSGKTPPHSMKNAAFAQRARFALAGLAAAWRRESSFRIQTVCSVLLLIASFLVALVLPDVPVA